MCGSFSDDAFSTSLRTLPSSSRWAPDELIQTFRQDDRLLLVERIGQLKCSSQDDFQIVPCDVAFRSQPDSFAKPIRRGVQML